jgi:putative inorganic carbon (HCO3(-)) transporter
MQRTAYMISALMLFVALILAPIIGGGFGEFSYAIIEVLVFGALTIYLLAPKNRQANFARAPGLAALAVFLVLFIISIFFSESLYPSLNQLLLVCACFGAYMLVASLSSEPKVAAAIVTGVALSALGVCAVGIRTYAISTGGGIHFWKSLMSSGDHMRLFGSFLNPGYFAGFIVVALPLTLGIYLVTRRSVLALLMGLAFIIETIALMLTGTKFGIISAVGGLLLFFMLAISTKSLRRSKFARLLGLAVILIPLLVVFSKPVKSRIEAVESGGSQVHSTTFRISTWQTTVEMMKAKPWVGVGPGVYAIAYPRYATAGPTKAAHQTYLQLASESGVFALIAFLAAIFAIGYRSIVNVLRHQSELVEHNEKNKESSDRRSLSWSDFVPFSGWRMMGCAMCGSLAASVTRNLVDSDWYIIGIALPFWMIAGVLVSTSGTTKSAVQPRWTKIGAGAVCLILALMSACFGLANRLAPNQFEEDMSFNSSLKGFKTASSICPINADYHRELAKYYAANDEMSDANKELQKAIKLAPTQSSNYQVAGMIELTYGSPKEAIKYFKQALECSPNSTNIVYHLSVAYGMLGDENGKSRMMTKLIEIENTDYEQLKGAPEIVDTTFARAHIYFGEKYMAEKKYMQAANEYDCAITRLERWRSNKQAVDIALYSGIISEQEKRDLLLLLRNSYYIIATAYDAFGKKSTAEEYRVKGAAVKID